MIALSILSPFLGILGSLLPTVVNILEKKVEYQHELQLLQLQLQGASQAAAAQLDIENVKADASEEQSLRSDDTDTSSSGAMGALRASIRPVITYFFFILFVAVKSAAAYMMVKSGDPIPAMLAAVWDQDTQALFATIMGFWFGARVLEKFYVNKLQNKTTSPVVAATGIKKK